MQPKATLLLTCCLSLAHSHTTHTFSTCVATGPMVSTVPALSRALEMRSPFCRNSPIRRWQGKRLNIRNHMPNGHFFFY